MEALPESGKRKQLSAKQNKAYSAVARALNQGPKDDFKLLAY